MQQIIRIFSFIFLLCFILLRVNGQDEHKELCVKVLLLNKVDSVFIFKDKQEDIVTYIRYLGIIRTVKKKWYKVIALKNIWGPNKHTNAQLRIYDEQNKYIGKYVLGDARDLPVKLNKNCLIFSNSGKECNTIIYKRINFHFGILNRIFIPACNGMGDIYMFSD